MHVVTSGDPAGEPLLLLHGTGPGATGELSFGPLLPGLRAHRCVVPDLVGFGRSSHPAAVPAGPGPWFARRVEAVLRLVDDLGPGRVHVVGHSYGARVALELLLRVPERIGRVVLLAAGGTPVKADLQKLTGFYREPSAAAMGDLVAAQLARPDVPDVAGYVRERFAVAVRPEVRRSFESAMAPGEPAPVYDRAVLGRVRHPVLVVHGKDDATIPPAASLFLAEHLPRADLHLFAGCGHLLQFEVPARLGALIDGFVRIER
ncbi:alpha/beta hydrolase fold protein [Pseudonocardia dioxanivorans CB1190]|uniref:Alpha/beta hydrolase fold protein n=1 Tax=Pseudonocardia dioxanivorans (strain ATCC 55486 / DSM 44775 / JCM 13855 / CB1190) TaxID=675635 RepID=F4CK42_PSEUX|nr:alpha/beta hydrolase [Pseudonocardia dioxanivorans]AEA28148.1 alpha/beta hydrolase fold protein [Pseudonocardia dioxanivorans CB1190]